MKLLLDQNISFRVMRSVSYVFEMEHVRFLGMESASDTSIWEYAKTHDCIIVTQDSDFYEKSLLFGFPPKIIWIRSGNVSTERMIQLFLSHQLLIFSFIAEKNHGSLILV